MAEVTGDAPDKWDKGEDNTKAICTQINQIKVHLLLEIWILKQTRVHLLTGC